MHFFVFCRNFGFNVEKMSNHYSQLKKHLKVDPETRSFDFLTKTHKKFPNIPKLCITLENGFKLLNLHSNAFKLISDYFQYLKKCVRITDLEQIDVLSFVKIWYFQGWSLSRFDFELSKQGAENSMMVALGNSRQYLSSIVKVCRLPLLRFPFPRSHRLWGFKQRFTVTFSLKR